MFGYSTRIENTSFRPPRASTRPESAPVPLMKPVLACTRPARSAFFIRPSSVPVSAPTASESRNGFDVRASRRNTASMSAAICSALTLLSRERPEPSTCTKPSSGTPSFVSACAVAARPPSRVPLPEIACPIARNS